MTTYRNFFWILLAFSLLTMPTAHAFTPYSSPQSQAQLIFHRLDANTVQVGLWIELKDNWHTYWQNPGDAGLAPKLDLEITPSVAVGDIQYPLPERITNGPLTTFGYHKQAVFVRQITLAETDTTTHTLNAKIKYLVCDKQCLIEKTEFTTSLSGQILPMLSAHSESDILNKFVWPTHKTTRPITTSADNQSVTIVVSPDQPLSTKITDFFPARQVALQFTAPQIVQNDVTATLKLQKSDLTPENPMLKGLIVGIDNATQKPFGIWYEGPWK